MTDEEELLRSFRKRGVRLTAQRRAVLRAVSSAGRYLSAAEVHERARQIQPRLGLATVYRTLALLSEVGAVRPARGCSRSVERAATFAAASLPHGHYVVCHSCGSAVEFAGCDIEPLIRRAAQKTGFRIDGHWLELSGECAACVAQRPSAKQVVAAGARTERRRKSGRSAAPPSTLMARGG